MSSPINISISAEAIAWYAALISTILLVIRFLEYQENKINIVLKCKANYRVYPGNKMYPPNKNYIVVIVINKGKRPVTIQSVGFISKNKNDKNGILSDSLLRGRVKLTEGESMDYLLEQDSVNLEKIKYFVAYDLTGREYKGKLESCCWFKSILSKLR